MSKAKSLDLIREFNQRHAHGAAVYVRVRDQVIRTKLWSRAGLGRGNVPVVWVEGIDEAVPIQYVSAATGPVNGHGTPYTYTRSAANLKRRAESRRQAKEVSSDDPNLLSAGDGPAAETR
jgi:hypothetical protein